LEHFGFHDPAVQGAKVERNLRLLRLEAAERPDDTFVLFNLASVHLGSGRPAEALPLLRRYLALSPPGDTVLNKVHALVGRAHHQLGQPAEALRACRTGCTAFPNDLELLFWEGVLLRELGDPVAAAVCLERLLRLPAGTHFTGMDEGVHGYKTRQVLGEI